MGTGVSNELTAARSEAAGAAKTPAAFAPVARRTALPGVVAGARLLLVALWLGGAVFFSFVVAPAAFAVLPQRELAGALVTRTIAVVNVGGFVASLAALGLGFLANDAAARRGPARLAETLALALVAICCGVSHWVVSARMLALRAAMGRPVDAVAANDPARAAFNSLHGYSVGLMMVAMIAGVVALLLVARRGDKSGV
jgi:ABC-type transport system involved in cytochrome bd biosynthesis fused ATPase/permease subunit